MFEHMTKNEAIIYCYQHKEDYIKSLSKPSEGNRIFDCLIEILESETIQPVDLPKYGMDF